MAALFNYTNRKSSGAADQKMSVVDINITKLYVSDVNVRKTLSGEEDETGIADLAADISTNGLINPITVRANGDRYEIIAGQRRYLAMKQLKKSVIPCNMLNISDQKAEEISLVENVQRNQMTNGDKIRSYSRLYDVYNKDIDKVVAAVHVSRATIMKYLKMRDLPEEVIQALDLSGENKISVDVAVELAKLPDTIDKVVVMNEFATLSTTQSVDAIKQFKASGCNINQLSDIKDNVVIRYNDLKCVPDCPYVFDNTTKKYVKIPLNIYDEIITLIKTKNGGKLEYC